jgi:hypothetical protein
MAIISHDREDLMVQAVAYCRRFQLHCPVDFRGIRFQTLFAGCRGDGRWSLYLDQLFVVQLTADLRLRRVQVHTAGDEARQLDFVADKDRLILLGRSQRGGPVRLNKQSVEDKSCADLLSELDLVLHQVAWHLDAVISQQPWKIDNLSDKQPFGPYSTLQVYPKGDTTVVPACLQAVRSAQPLRL